jgi:Holliday junction resolvase-like predicted endonuclease
MKNEVALLVERLNSTSLPMEPATPFSHTDHAEMMAHALHQFYHPQRKHQGKGPYPWLRMSALGKPHVLNMCLKPHIQDELVLRGFSKNQAETELDAMTLLQGHLFESWFVTALKRHGWDVIYPTQTGEQLEVNYRGVLGHIDVLARDHSGVSHLIECKSIGSGGAYMFVKDYHSKPTYLTQLALYSHAVKLPHNTAGWVLWNKQAPYKEDAFHYVQPIGSDLLEARLSVDYLLDTEHKVNTLEELLETGYFLPPLAEQEVYQREFTGRWKLPMEMSFSPYKYLFYDIVVEKNKRGKLTEYVLSERSYAEVVDKFPIIR